MILLLYHHLVETVVLISYNVVLLSLSPYALLLIPIIALQKKRTLVG